MNQRITIESIVQAANQTGHTLTVQQAQSIMSRHNQLVKEGQNLIRERNRQYQNYREGYRDE